MKDFGLKKLYYSISEVSKLTGLEQYILRYWETEFEQLKPQKNRAGNRIYTNKEIDLINKIKKLLREQKYTIEGAKKIISGGEPDPTEYTPQDTSASENKKDRSDKDVPIKKVLEELKDFLVDLSSQI